MEQLMNALKETYPHIDFENNKALVDSGAIDSLAMVNIIAMIEEMFDIVVTMEYLQPAHFQSVETIWEMVEELA
jgi:acyl carrier protein